MNAIGYTRVSTLNQEDGYGMDAQKNEINAWATAHNYTIIRWVEETGSGAKERPLFEEIVYGDEDVDAVIVFKNDRVARDTKLYFYYLYQLEKRNIKLLSTQEEFDDAYANIYRALLQFVAEQERANITKRTSNGRKIKASNGGYSGGKPPYGYMVKDGSLVINPKESEIIKRIFTYKGTLEDKADMLNELGFVTRSGGKFKRSTIGKIMSRKAFYEGTYSYGGITSKGDYELCL